MKTISFAVPCYNSAAYMEKCIDPGRAVDGSSFIVILGDILKSAQKQDHIVAY